MKDKFNKLRAYYRFKTHFPIGAIVLPWVRKRVKKLLKASNVKELVRTEGNLLIPVRSDESVFRRIQETGSVDPGMEWIIKRYVKQGTVAIDVGANMGFISILMADRIGDDGEVYAIEPNIKLHSYIRRLFDINALENLKLIYCACSDKQGIARFKVDISDHTKSMVTDTGGLEINVMPLDSILAENSKTVSFVKIDVEGHEPNVLVGSKKTLSIHKPTLVFETGLHSPSDIEKINKILDDIGYDVIGIIKNWGIEEKALMMDMTEKTHCNVLALPIKR